MNPHYKGPLPKNLKVDKKPHPKNPDLDNPDLDNQHVIINELIINDLMMEEEAKNLIQKFKSVFDEEISKGQARVLSIYVKMFSYDLVDYGLDISAKYNAQKPIYLIRILEDWKNSGLNTKEKVKEKIKQDQRRRKRKNKKETKVRGS